MSDRSAGTQHGADLSLEAEFGNGLSPLAGKTVFVAEDNIILSMHLCLVLEDAGARVIGPFPFVHEGLAALTEDALERALPDLALLDFELAEGDAGPIADRLRALGIPFAFFTGHPADEVCPCSGDAPVMRKPNTDRQIVSTMSELIAA